MYFLRVQRLRAYVLAMTNLQLCLDVLLCSMPPMLLFYLIIAA